MLPEESLAQAPTAGQPEAPGSLWGRVLDRFRRRRARREAAHALYRTLVDQARSPLFFADWGVPDSRDGRLEMVGLHVILVMRRLRQEGRTGQELARELLELMLADLDQHLREWGIGDLSVGKHMKKLANTFFARLAALDESLDQGDLASLAAVLRRNVFSGVADPDPAMAARLAAYLQAQDHRLAAQDGTALLAGRLAFAVPGAEA